MRSWRAAAAGRKCPCVPAARRSHEDRNPRAGRCRPDRRNDGAFSWVLAWWNWENAAVIPGILPALGWRRVFGVLPPGPDASTDSADRNQ